MFFCDLTMQYQFPLNVSSFMVNLKYKPQFKLLVYHFYKKI